MKWLIVSAFRVEVLIISLAAVTVTMFALAGVHNSDVYWGDSTILSALRVDNQTWQQFFARFDLTIPISVSSVLVVSAGLWVFRKSLEAVASLFILPAMVLTITLPKILIGRPRPEGELEGMTNSFPSGTAATSVLVLGFLIYLVGEFVAPRKLRIGLQLLLGLAIVTLGVFRMLAGEHWPSDLAGGYMAGALALFAIIWLYRRLRDRDRILSRRQGSKA